VRKWWLRICPVAGIRIPISHACSRGKIEVVEIRRLSGGSFSGSLINLAIKLAGATSANIAGKE
jgi:hypothetical protein